MKVLVIGANQGIGAAIATQLMAEQDCTVIRTSRQYQQLDHDPDHGWTVHCDVTDESSIEAMASQIQQQFKQLDWLINCAGTLHTEQYMPEKTLKQVNQPQMSEQFMTNAVGHLLVLKTLQPLLTADEPTLVCSVSARIGSIEDNHLGGWYAYRMSKAALNMGMKTTAIEWARKSPQVKFLLLHPGTTDTALSAPFQQRLPKGQLQSESTTAQLLIKQLNKHQHHDSKYPLYLDHHGQSIPW